MERTIAEQTNQLKGQDEGVKYLRTKIQNLNQDLQGVDATLVSSNTELTNLESQQQGLATKIGYLEEQLGVINAALQTTPNDVDLLAHQKTVSSELEAAKAQQADLTTKHNRVTGQIAIFTANKSEISLSIAARNAELTNLLSTLVVSSPELKKLTDDLELNKQVAIKIPRINELLAQESVVFRTGLLQAPEAMLMNLIGNAFTLAASENTRLTDQGILEVRYDNQWKGVCDDEFNAKAATVACKSLGLTYVSFNTSQRSSSNPGFWLDDVVCNGTEEDLFQCRHDGVGRENCDSDEYVKLVCR